MRLGSGIALGVVSLVVAVACTTSASQPSEPAPAVIASVDAKDAPAPVIELPPYVDRSAFTAAYRRMTESQYRHVIADAFGPDVTINARFEPERREEGLQAVGNAQLSITTSGLEQYLSVARSIADQVVDGKVGDPNVACASRDAADQAACAASFVKLRGQQLFRRPLSEGEAQSFLTIWSDAMEQSDDFRKSLKLSLVGMLMSPEFLFRVERAEADPEIAQAYRLDAYSMASRVSFLLWDTGPDAELLRAASTGELQTADGLGKQIERMSASPRVADGVRAFFTDMLFFEAFDTLTKDAATYPLFSQAVADSAREETLRFLVKHLVERRGDCGIL